MLDVVVSRLAALVGGTAFSFMGDTTRALRLGKVTGPFMGTRGAGTREVGFIRVLIGPPFSVPAPRSSAADCCLEVAGALPPRGLARADAGRPMAEGARTTGGRMPLPTLCEKSVEDIEDMVDIFDSFDLLR
jgi:hypothetical protein